MMQYCSVISKKFTKSQVEKLQYTMCLVKAMECRENRNLWHQFLTENVKENT